MQHKTIKLRDMYTQDKILNGGEITQAGVFSREGTPFYVFLMAKTDGAAGVAAMTAQLNDSQSAGAFPFMSGTWNPVVLRSLTVTQADLQNYRIFWGIER